MKKWKKRLAQGLLVSMIGSRILGNDITIRAAWQPEGNDWYYYQKDGTKFTGWLTLAPEEWYYLAADGKMVTGWYQDTDGSWYYLTPKSQGVEGQMKSGWYLAEDGAWYFLDTRHEGSFGRALTNGWQWIDGYCYYFHENGVMHSAGTTPDGYMVNSLGQWTENGVAQYISGKGILTKKAESTPRASSSRLGSSGSSGNPGISQEGSGSKPAGYRVYEESNVTVFPTKDSVKAFANKTEQDKEELKKLANSVADYWTDASNPEIISQSQGETQFQSVQQLHLVVEETSPLYELIQAGNIVENDVVMIPSCEYFPTGLSVVYEGNDDDYKGQHLQNYDATRYQVIHVAEASFEDIFPEKAQYHAGGVNSSKPVEFIWLPSVFREQVQTQMLWEPTASGLKPENASDMEVWGTATPSIAERSLDWGTATPSVAERSLGWGTATPSVAERSLENGEDTVFYSRSSKTLADSLSFSKENGSTGANLLLKADNIVLYDGDGDYLTKDDQIVMNGKIGLENVNPKFGFIWEPGLSSMMPQQLKAVVDYDQVIQLKVSCNDSVNMDEFMKAIRQAVDMPENRQSLLGIELQGVDWNKTVVLASVGVNIGMNRVEYRMKDIKYSTQSVFTRCQPMVVFMVLMDYDGNISVKTAFTTEYRDKCKSGINVQKKGFSGSLGTQSENRGDFNAELAGYDINMFNRHDSNLSVSLKTEGAADLDTSIGIGAGFMCFGIMPAMVKGSIGLKSNFSGSGAVLGSKNSGISWTANGEASIRAYLKAKALVKLKVKAKYLMHGEKGFEREFDLADLTLLEGQWKGTTELPESPAELTYDNSYKKYYNYTQEQLEKEFHKYEFDSHENHTASGKEIYRTIVYYDGNGQIPVKDYGTWKEVDYEHIDPSNNILIELTRTDQLKDDGQRIEGQYDFNNKLIIVKLKNVIHGITDKTLLKNLQKFGNLFLSGQGSNTYLIDLENLFYTWGLFNGNMHDLELFKPEFLKGINIAELQQIMGEYTADGMDAETEEELCSRLLDRLLDKTLNKEAYVVVLKHN